MAITLPLDKMTPAEKQEAIELLWHDLYGEEEPLPMPEWQIAALREREAAAARGDDPLLSMDEVRGKFREDFGCR